MHAEGTSRAFRADAFSALASLAIDFVLDQTMIQNIIFISGFLFQIIVDLILLSQKYDQLELILLKPKTKNYSICLKMMKLIIYTKQHCSYIYR